MAAANGHLEMIRLLLDKGAVRTLILCMICRGDVYVSQPGMHRLLAVCGYREC